MILSRPQDLSLIFGAYDDSNNFIPIFNKSLSHTYTKSKYPLKYVGQTLNTFESEFFKNRILDVHFIKSDNYPLFINTPFVTPDDFIFIDYNPTTFEHVSSSDGSDPNVVALDGNSIIKEFRISEDYQSLRDIDSLGIF